MDHTKMQHAYLDSPRRELSNGGLEISAVAAIDEVGGTRGGILCFFCDQFLVSYFFEFSENVVPIKMYPAESILPRRILVCRGLRPFWGDSVCWQIYF